jgi:hypothetical protein
MKKIYLNNKLGRKNKCHNVPKDYKMDEGVTRFFYGNLDYQYYSKQKTGTGFLNQKACSSGST